MNCFIESCHLDTRKNQKYWCRFYKRIPQELSFLIQLSIDSPDKADV